MIALIRGICLEKNPTQAIVDCNGVGYDIKITLQCYQMIGNVGDEVTIFTHLGVSEHDMSLYGFGSTEEKEMFRFLIAVNGVGPRTAQAILSGIPVDELKQAIAFGDLNKLKSVSGIGKKTAERMIVELKDKLGNIQIDMRGKSASDQIKSAASKTPLIQMNDSANEAILALISLGYKKVTAEKSVRTLLKEDPFLKVEELITKSLRSI
jgi:Holliday junction DNA helicase RuvA